MTPRLLLSAPILGVLGAMAILSAGPSYALSSKECSARYQNAKKQEKLNGLSWNEFRKKECAGVEETEVKPEVKSEVKPTIKAEEKPSYKSGSGGVVFPKGIDPKYSKESAGRARLHTCLDQYNANKGNGSNGGNKWIMKGGGYYSLCNRALKG